MNIVSSERAVVSLNIPSSACVGDGEGDRLTGEDIFILWRLFFHTQTGDAVESFGHFLSSVLPHGLRENLRQGDRCAWETVLGGLTADMLGRVLTAGNVGGFGTSGEVNPNVFHGLQYVDDDKMVLKVLEHHQNTHRHFYWEYGKETYSPLNLPSSAVDRVRGVSDRGYGGVMEAKYATLYRHPLFTGKDVDRQIHVLEEQKGKGSVVERKGEVPPHLSPWVWIMDHDMEVQYLMQNPHLSAEQLDRLKACAILAEDEPEAGAFYEGSPRCYDESVAANRGVCSHIVAAAVERLVSVPTLEPYGWEYATNWQYSFLAINILLNPNLPIQSMWDIASYFDEQNNILSQNDYHPPAPAISVLKHNSALTGEVYRNSDIGHRKQADVFLAAMKEKHPRWSKL